MRFARLLAMTFGVVMLAVTLPSSADVTDSVTRIILPAPPRPEALGTGPSSISISWFNVSRLAQGWEVQYATDPENGPWQQATAPQFISITNCQRLAVPKSHIDPTTFSPDPNTLPDQIAGQFNPYYTDPSDPDGLCSVTLPGTPHIDGGKADHYDPFAASATTVYWYRVRALFPGNLSVQKPGGGTLSESALPPNLVPGPWSAVDPALLGPKPPANFTVSVANFPTAKLLWTNAAAGDPMFCRNQFYRDDVGPKGAQPISPILTQLYDPNPLKYDTTYEYHLSSVRCVNAPLPPDPNTGAPAEPAHIENSFSEAAGNATGSIPGFIIQTPPIPPPGTPTNLTAVFVPPDHVNLQWTDNSTDEDGFLIEYGPSCNNFVAQTAVQTPDGQSGATGPRATMQFGVLGDTVRCYRVFAYRVSPLARSLSSNTASIFAVPKAPSNLQASNVTSFANTLTWTDNATTECESGNFCAQFQTTGFRVEFCDPSLFNCTTQGWLTAGLVNGIAGNGGTGQLLDGRFASTTLKYRVFATNAAGDSAPSNVISVTTPGPPLNPPANLAATVGGTHWIQLTWTGVAGNNGYRVEFSDISAIGPFRFLANASKDAVKYDDFSALGGHTRCYRVRAINGSQQSDPSNVACATTPLGNFPAPPTQLQGAPSTSNPNAPTKVVALQWQDNSSNEIGFVIEVSGDNGQNWRVVGSVGANVQTIKVGNFEPHSTQLFRVKAFNSDGDSPYSNNAAVTLLGPSRPVWLHPAKDGEIQSTACQADGKYSLGQGVGPSIPNSDLEVIILRKTGTMAGTVVNCNTIGCSDTWCQNIDHTGRNTCQVYNQVDSLKVEFDWSGAGTFRLQFHFAANIVYELHAIAINSDGPSGDAFIPSFSVAADCPTG